MTSENKKNLLSNDSLDLPVKTLSLTDLKKLINGTRYPRDKRTLAQSCSRVHANIRIYSLDTGSGHSNGVRAIKGKKS